MIEELNIKKMIIGFIKALALRIDINIDIIVNIKRKNVVIINVFSKMEPLNTVYNFDQNVVFINAAI